MLDLTTANLFLASHKSVMGNVLFLFCTCLITKLKYEPQNETFSIFYHHQAIRKVTHYK